MNMLCVLNFWNLIKWDTSIIATLVKFETNRKMYIESIKHLSQTFTW